MIQLIYLLKKNQKNQIRIKQFGVIIRLVGMIIKWVKFVL